MNATQIEAKEIYAELKNRVAELNAARFEAEKFGGDASIKFVNEEKNYYTWYEENIYNSKNSIVYADAHQ